MSVLVITDSTSYLSPDIVQRYGIEIVPLNVHFGNIIFKEGTTYSNADYYNMLKNSQLFPHTSQPSPREFLEKLEKAEADDEALIIVISSALSGTVQSAHLAGEMLQKPNIKVSIFDSRSTAMGLGFMVMHACELRNAGLSVAAIMEELEKMREQMNILFVVENLEYLVRGGRMSKVAGSLGSLLKIKPVLTLVNGEIKLFQKVRTFPRAIQLLQDELNRNANTLHKICIVYVGYHQKALELQQTVSQLYDVPVITSELGPVIGSHLGPGALGVIFY